VNDRLVLGGNTYWPTSSERYLGPGEAMSELDRDILKAIKGYSPQSPQDLAGILAAVEARQRLILTYEELIGGIDRLIERGRVAEAGNCRYYVPKSPPAIRSFSGYDAQAKPRMTGVTCSQPNELTQRGAPMACYARSPGRCVVGQGNTSR
jgi:hypothetical protein